MMIPENVSSQKNFYINQKFKFNILSLLNILSFLGYIIINQNPTHLNHETLEDFLDNKLKKISKRYSYPNIRRIVEIVLKDLSRLNL